MDERAAWNAIKVLVVIAIVGVIAAAWSSREARKATATGAPAPSLDGAVRVDGKAGPLPIAQGRPTVVNIWATWCRPCLAEIPDLAAAARALQGRVDFVGLAVDSSADEVAAVVARLEVPYPIALIDDAASARWNVRAIPSTFVLDGDGHIAWHATGVITRAQLDAALLDVE